MIIIIHGENLARSRDVISQLKTKLDIKIPDVNLTAFKKELDINEITPGMLREITSSYGIFSDPPFVVLDVSNAGRKNLADYIPVLEKLPNEVTLIIYSKKELSKANIFIKNSVSLKAKIVENTVDPKSNIFRFVDALFSRDKTQSYKEYKNLLVDGEEPFYIFTMIIFGLRNTAYAVFDSPELQSLAPFVKQKSQKQAKNFSSEKITELYKTIYTMDLDMKTGKLNIELGIPLLMEKIL